MMNLLNKVTEILENGEPQAWTYLTGNSRYPDLKGIALFYPVQGSTLVVVAVEGLPGPGFYGLHIHEGRSCTGNMKDPFADAGPHFNPTSREHPKHAGDLPPLLSNEGIAYLAFVTGRFIPKEVIGRTMIIHNMPDDFISQPAGNAGSKIACGEIQSSRVR